MKRTAVLAAMLGLLGLTVATFAQPPSSRSLTMSEIQEVYGGDSSPPINPAPALTCYVPNTANCPASQDCTNTQCDPITNTCPANTVTITQSQATFANASQVVPPLPPGVTAQGDKTNQDQIPCGQTYTCSGCKRILGGAFKNWCAVDANQGNGTTNNVIPTVPDPSKPCGPVPAPPN